jgi:lysozyme
MRWTGGIVLALALAGCQVHDDFDGSFAQALIKCPNGSVTEGVDVSNSNGTIDWSMVAGAGISFAYLRATEGTTLIDASFATNWSSAGTAGLLRGPIHFFHPGLDPVTQADFFVQNGGGSAPGDLPPALDLEVTDGQSTSTVVQNASAFLARVQASTGRTPVLYIGSSFFTSLGSPSGFATQPLWIPNTGVVCPNIPDPPWTDWAFWQYSITGSVSGITGNVDRDRFNGSLTDLQGFIAATSTPDGGADGGPSDGGAPSDASVAPPDLTAPMPDDGVSFDDLLNPAPDLSVPQDLSLDAAAPSPDLAGGNGSGGCSCNVSRSAPPPWSLLLVAAALLLRRRPRRLGG